MSVLNPSPHRYFSPSPQNRIDFLSTVILSMLCSIASFSFAADPTAGPADVTLEFTSPFDGSQQPYRVYLPSAYDGKSDFPMLVTLHGTGGDQDKYFDHEVYHSGIYKTEAEKRGIILLSPLGTDGAGRPTEWRGEAEINVLAALQDAQTRFRIDKDRIVCTGQSMGGTGTSYLTSRYPDIFAAGIPLASTYSHVSLVANLRDVPMLYVQGADDWPIYAATGPIPITEEMKRLGYSVELWMIEGGKHNTFGVSTPRVIDFALQQHRVAHPKHILHRAYFPAHGRAWWVEIAEIERPGWYAEVDAQVKPENRIELSLKNASQVILRPDPRLYDAAKALTINGAGGKELFRDVCDLSTEILLRLEGKEWTATARPRHEISRTDWKCDDQIVGIATEPPTWEGGPETTLGNWITDAMRDISGADIAICTRGHFRIGNQMRGRPIATGEPIHLMEFISWQRPSDSALAEFKVTGATLLKIIENNLLDDDAKRDRFLVQVSGCRYQYDMSRPYGSRVVDTDIVPDREYRVVCNSSQITRTDTLELGDLHGNLKHRFLEPNLLSSTWRYALKHEGKIAAKLEGRVTEVKQ